MTLNECERHFRAIRAATTVGEACYELEPLFDVYDLMQVGLGRGSVFWRARIAGPTPWPTIDEMSYPPAQFASIGRLSDQNSPFFYAASRETTALAEIHAATGQHVQLGGFRVMLGEPIRIAVVGELYHVFKTGYLRLMGVDPGRTFSKTLNSKGIHAGLRLVYIDAFLAELLADPKASENGYLFSRAVASMIFRREYVEGLFFPSVRDQFGMNLGLRPEAFDTKVNAVCCTHGRIQKVRSFGLVDHEILSDAEQMSDDGELKWLPPLSKTERRFFGLTKEEFEAARSASPEEAMQMAMSVHTGA